MVSANVGVSGGRVRAFTLVELLVVISIIGILAALLFPVFTRARISGQMTSCASNLHQAALALSLYQQDYGLLPPVTLKKYGNYSWDAVQPYAKSEAVTRCPYYWRSFLQGTYCTAKWQLRGSPRALNADTVVAYCVEHLDRVSDHGMEGFSLESGFYTVAFGDGSAKRIDARQTSRWLWKNGKWMLEDDAFKTPGTLVGSWVETRFPGEPWPPE